MPTLQEDLIRWNTKEIEELKQLIIKYGEYADVHQSYIDEFINIDNESAKEAIKSSTFWRNHYQQKECYCRQQLFKKQIELQKLQY